MSTFAGDIQVVCLGTLTLLIIYTLWLSRYRGLDGHLAVRWLLIQGGALLTIMFWRWLPLFSVTSSLQDRELLLMVTVLLFAFVIFLALDLLVRNSRQSAQIKRLTQELAIQRERIDRLVHTRVAAAWRQQNVEGRGAGMSLDHTVCGLFHGRDYGLQISLVPQGFESILDGRLS